MLIPFGLRLSIYLGDDRGYFCYPCEDEGMYKQIEYIGEKLNDRLREKLNKGGNEDM